MHTYVCPRDREKIERQRQRDKAGLYLCNIYIFIICIQTYGDYRALPVVPMPAATGVAAAAASGNISLLVYYMLVYYDIYDDTICISIFYITILYISVTTLYISVLDRSTLYMSILRRRMRVQGDAL